MRNPIGVLTSFRAQRAARVAIALLRDGHPLTLLARGGSMWPAVRPGARLRLLPCAADALSPGDLAAYAAADDRLIIHRLTGRSADGSLHFRGDSLAHADPPVAPAKVLGRALLEAQPPLHVRWPTRRELGALVRFGLRQVRSASPRARAAVQT